MRIESNWNCSNCGKLGEVVVLHAMSHCDHGARDQGYCRACIEKASGEFNRCLELPYEGKTLLDRIENLKNHAPTQVVGVGGKEIGRAHV